MGEVVEGSADASCAQVSIIWATRRSYGRFEVDLTRAERGVVRD